MLSVIFSLGTARFDYLSIICIPCPHIKRELRSQRSQVRDKVRLNSKVKYLSRIIQNVYKPHKMYSDCMPCVRMDIRSSLNLGPRRAFSSLKSLWNLPLDGAELAGRAGPGSLAVSSPSPILTLTSRSVCLMFRESDCSGMSKDNKTIL